MTSPSQDQDLRTALEAERTELQKANSEAPGWGAAVGARAERIQEIDSRLASLSADSTGPAVIGNDHEPMTSTDAVRMWEMEQAAALTPSAPIAAPLGYKLVSRDLSQDMEDVADKFGDPEDDDWISKVRRLWWALVDAAPQPPVRDDGHSKDFQLMLVRIIQRHRNGRDLAETLKGAEDLLKRKGSLSVFRSEVPAPAGDVPGEAQTDNDYEVLATIYDGTKILAPKCKSDRFTTQEIRDAITKHFAGEAQTQEGGR